MTSENEEQTAKLAALVARLQEGENSPLVEDFDFEVFFDELNDQCARNS